MSIQNKSLQLESHSRLANKAYELQSKESTGHGTDLTTKLTPESDGPNKTSSKRIFILFLLTNLFVNYDTGVIPASLVEIEKELKVDYTQEAALGNASLYYYSILGSLVYLGLSAASLFVSPTFKRFDAKNVLGINIFLNAVFCAGFSYFNDLIILYFCRIMMGVTQAFCVIYAPVWVNEFSPANKNATWMGILHAFVLLGIEETSSF
jgi:Sugar (and other) transporter.